MSDEKRKHPRAPANEDARLSSGGGVFDGTIVDVSAGGMGIEFGFDLSTSPETFDIGSHIEVEPEEGKRRRGMVVRRYVNGLGLQFVDEPDD